MTEVIKAALIGIMGVLLALQFKYSKPAFGMLLGIAISVLIFLFSASQIQAVTVELARLQGYLGNAKGYLGILFKVIGITYICEFCAGFCKDAGFHSVAAQIEILGKLAVVFAGLPVLFAVINQLNNLG